MKVCMTACATYEIQTVRAALEELLAPLGGMQAFVQKGQRVFVKLNMVEMAEHTRAEVTHPALAEAVAALAVEAGGVVTLGDCPSALCSDAQVQHMYDAMGYTAAAKRAGAQTAVCRTTQRVLLQGYRVAHYICAADMANCDVLINLPKLKTHTLTKFTGAVKNLYGTVHGTEKLKYHAQFPAVRDFAAFLVDIAQTLRPALNILDAVLCHEGQGPTGGTPKQVGVLAAAADIHALDYAAVQLMCFEPTHMPTLAFAMEQGLLEASQLEYPMQTPQQLRGRAFRAAEGSLVGQQLRKLIPKGLRDRWVLRPRVSRHRCVGCGQCARVCPADAISIAAGRAQIAYDRCQKCFCCQELCPRKAVQAVHYLRHKAPTARRAAQAEIAYKRKGSTGR